MTTSDNELSKSNSSTTQNVLINIKKDDYNEKQ